jgi:two-component system sensor histidine kinase AgrC
MMVKMCYATLILIFAIIGMTMLLNLNPLRLPRGRRFAFFAAMVFVIAASIVLMLQHSGRFAALYPLLVHLPLVVIFCVVSQRGLAKVLFVLLTTVFLSYPPALADELLMKWASPGPVTELLTAALSCALVLLFLKRFLQPDFAYVMETVSSGETARFCLVPIGYNILVYELGKYGYGTCAQPLRIVLFVSAMGVFFLLLRVLRRSRELERMHREQSELHLQMETAKDQLSALRASQQQAATYRHDLRHHLSLLKSFLDEGDLDKLSAQLPETLPVSDTELCSLLSNALENAVAAAAQVEDEKLRRVYLRALVAGNKLLISTENAYSGRIQWEGELPQTQSREPGHGLGVRSMVSITERRGGLYSFETADGVFMLRLMLPLAT